MMIHFFPPHDKTSTHPAEKKYVPRRMRHLSVPWAPLRGALFTRLGKMVLVLWLMVLVLLLLVLSGAGILSWLNMPSSLSLLRSGSLPSHRVQKAFGLYVLERQAVSFVSCALPLPQHCQSLTFDFRALLRAAAAYRPDVRNIMFVQL